MHPFFCLKKIIIFHHILNLEYYFLKIEESKIHLSLSIC